MEADAVADQTPRTHPIALVGLAKGGSGRSDMFYKIQHIPACIHCSTASADAHYGDKPVICIVIRGNKNAPVAKGTLYE